MRSNLYPNDSFHKVLTIKYHIMIITSFQYFWEKMNYSTDTLYRLCKINISINKQVNNPSMNEWIS